MLETKLDHIDFTVGNDKGYEEHYQFNFGIGSLYRYFAGEWQLVTYVDCTGDKPEDNIALACERAEEDFKNYHEV